MNWKSLGVTNPAPARFADIIVDADATKAERVWAAQFRALIENAGGCGSELLATLEDNMLEFVEWARPRGESLLGLVRKIRGVGAVLSPERAPRLFPTVGVTGETRSGLTSKREEQRNR